jgi:hypothetical protein
MIRLAVTYGAVASTGAAAWVGWGQGQVELAGAVILAALAFLAFRLWLGGVDLGARLPRRDTVASVALVGMIVTAGVAGPMSIPASGETVTEQCNPLDNQVSYLVYPLNSGVEGFTCVLDYYTTSASTDTDSEQTKVDIYSDGKQLSQSADNYLTTGSNYANDTETVAWSKMQVAVAESYKNGSTESQAKLAAENAIEDYYAVQQRNLLAQWNTHVSTLWELKQVAKNEQNVSEFHVRMVPRRDGYSGTPYEDNDYIWDAQENRTITLANGSDVTAKQLSISYAPGSSDSGAISLDTGSVQEYEFKAGYVAPPTDSYNKTKVIDFARYYNQWNTLESKESSVVSEAQTYVNATYGDYEAGNINASDVISSQTAMFEYGTQRGGSNQSLYDAVGALALAGYDTPTLNGSGTMDVSYDNQTYTGLVMAHSVPGGSWEANTTYNTSNFDGPVFVATTSGTKVDIPENETFTIETIRAQDGSEINNVSTTRYNYKTANASELLEVQEQLTALNAELESREGTGGGGGWDLGGSNSYLVIVAVGAAVLLLLRD